MCNIAKFVTDPTAKKILTETDGIGTPATRAAIIELVDRGYVTRSKKVITSTSVSRALIRMLPEPATVPDMTATWEAATRKIEQGETVEPFLARVAADLRILVDEGKTMGQLDVGGGYPCPKPGCPGRLRRVKGRNGPFWSCHECRTTVADASGKPRMASLNAEQPHRARKASQ